MGSASNTMFFNERPGDITALMAQAGLALQGATATPTSAPQNSSVVPAPSINGGRGFAAAKSGSGGGGGAPAVE
jgi:hypothetical protein